MNAGLIVLIVVIVIVLLLVVYVVSTYNKLVTLRNRVKDGYSQIDVQLKRRFDLIPNILETVKGYAKHESETLKGVIEARNKYTVASTVEAKAEANNILTDAVRQLFALSESYPDLKANTNFLSLQETLQDTENKISVSRQFYNDTVLTYNNKIEMFPSNLIASSFKFTKEPFFEAPKEASEAPKVNF